MTFRLAAYLSLQGGKEAAAEVRRLKTETDALKTSSQGLTTQSGAEEAALAGIGAEATRNATILNRLGGAYDSMRQRAGAAFTRMRNGFKGTGDSADTAAGSVANLTAQVFDVGVMMQAGQNPLQLALQQGTQVAQVLGPMGAAGAARALGTTFIGLLNPINLVTIGSIAAGAAMMNWLTRAKDEAEDLDDILERIPERLDAYRKIAERNSVDLIKLYGGSGQDVQSLQDDLQALSLSELLRDAGKAGKELAEGLEPNNIQDLFDEPSRRADRTGRGKNYHRYRALIEGIGASENVDEQITAIQEIQDVLKSATGGVRSMTKEQEELYRQTLEVLDALTQVKSASQALPQHIRDQIEATVRLLSERQKIEDQLNGQIALAETILRHGEQSVEVEALRAEQARDVLEARLAEKGFLPQIIDQILELKKIEQDRARAVRDARAGREADNQVAQLRAEADIRRAIVQHGRDSLEVQKLRIAAQRQMHEQMLATQNISEARKNQLRAEWEATYGLASPDPFGTLAASGDFLRQSEIRLERLRQERDLLGQTEDTRRRIKALFEAEVLIRQQNLDATSARAEEVRAAVLEEAMLTREIERQAQAWDGLRSSGMQAVDDVFGKLLEQDVGGAIEAMTSEIAGAFQSIAITNPIKNALFGVDLPTMQDLGGIPGVLNRLIGAETATPDFSSMRAFSAGSMNVTAMNVVMGGPGVHALAGLATGLAGGAPAPAGAVDFLKTVSKGGATRPGAIAGLDARLASPLSVMIAKAQTIFGPDAVQVSSAYRSVKHQEQLWAAALKKYGSPDLARKWVAPPGRSRHNYGMAADLAYGSGDVRDWFHANASKFGLGYRMKHEPWHIEPTAIALGPPAGETQKALDALTAATSSATKNLDTMGDGFNVFGNLLQNLSGIGGGGTGSFGSFIASIFKGGNPVATAVPTAIPANADGGYQYFPGGSRADTGTIRISSGEFIVNGNATARHRGLLEWINAGGHPAGGLPAFARGGGYGTEPFSAGPREVQLVNNTGRPMQATVEDEPLPGGGRRERYVFSEMVGDALTMPGGAARRVMANQMGVKPKAPYR